MCCWLQREDANEVKLSKIRFYFDKLIIAYPAVENYSGKDSDLAHSPDSDNAVVKIQHAADRGKSTLLLSSAEKAAVAVYALDPTYDETQATSKADDDEPSFIDMRRNEYDSK